ncbi:MAG: right-handed parallel beta-helix repeat-containing protein [Lentisphaeria bacterium]|nr:right-handed parallel beta-helix repeat-containing protein [Lentisphaeria bacterium]
MKGTPKTLCLGALICAALSGLAGAEIFVSPRGDDNAPGTRNAPLKTIVRAFEKAKPGDTVRLLPGVFSEHAVLRRSGRRGAEITIAGTRSGNGEYLSIVQAPGKVLTDWQPAPEVGENVWKTPLEKRPDLVMKDGAMIAYINPLTMALPQRKVLPEEITDVYIVSKFGPGCKRLAGLDLLRMPDQVKFTHENLGRKRENFWEVIGRVLAGWKNGYLYIRLAGGQDISKCRITATYGEGFLLEDASFIVLKDLHIRASRIQIRITGKSSNNSIENCLLMHGGSRVRIDKTASATTVRNNIMTCGFIRNDLFMQRSPKDMRGGALYEIFKYIIGTALSDDIGVANYGPGSKIADNIIVQGLIGIRAFGPDMTVSGNVIHGMSSVGIVTCSLTTGRFFRNLVMNCGIPLRIHEYCNPQAQREEYHYNNLFIQARHDGQHILVHCYAKLGRIYKASPRQEKKEIPKLSDHEKTFIYHNTFWGGRDTGVPFTVSRFSRTFRKVMPFFVINNIFKDHPWHATDSHELAGPNLLYQFQAPDKPRRDKKVPKLNKVVGVKDSAGIWKEKGLAGLPDLSLAENSPALSGAVDISKPFTAGGKEYPALPGFESGYFKGEVPAFGALQQHEDMTFFNERFRRTVSAMKTLSSLGISMPVPGVR